MCGLIGFIGTANVDPDKFKILMLYNEGRGKDSSGIYIKEEGKLLKDSLIKRIGLTSGKMLPTLDIPNSNLVIAHTRAATYGAVTEANSHPFVYNNVVGVHNGKISNNYDLRQLYNYTYQDIDVDSQIFFKYLGNCDNYKVLSDYDGAAALLFTKDDGKLYVYHDKERPLFKGSIKYNDGTKGIYFSSLEDSLKAISCKDIKSIKEDILHIYNTSGNCEVKKIIRTPYKHQHVSTNTYSSSNHNTSNVHKNVGNSLYTPTNKVYTVNELKYPHRISESPYNRIPALGYKGESVYWANNQQFIEVRYENGTKIVHRLQFKDVNNVAKPLIITLTKFGQERILDTTKVIFNKLEFNDGGYEEMYVRTVPYVKDTTPVTPIINTKTINNTVTKNPYENQQSITKLELNDKNGIAKLSISDKLIQSYHYQGGQYLIDRLDVNVIDKILPSKSDTNSTSPFKDDKDIAAEKEESDFAETTYINSLKDLSDEEYWARIMAPSDDTDPDDYSPIDKSLDVDFKVSDNDNELMSMLKSLSKVKTKLKNLLTFVESKVTISSTAAMVDLEGQILDINKDVNEIMLKPVV